jgi:hypothetical protein
MPMNPRSRRTVGRQVATPPRGAKAPPTAAAGAPDPVIEQAKRDIDAGMVDTDMRATPGLDAELRARLVPGPSGKPPSRRR